MFHDLLSGAELVSGENPSQDGTVKSFSGTMNLAE
jgi:hypothetical protein